MIISRYSYIVRLIYAILGTGTGLLAMMAVKAGALHVYACEVFPTLAHLASAITVANLGSIRSD